MPDTDPADAPITPASPPAPLAILAAIAENPECDVEKMTAIVELQRSMAADEAKAGWADAMARFQADAPLIVKAQTADRYSFASHAYIMERIRPLLAECGLSLSFSSEILADGRIHLTCQIAHGTHVETRDFSCPVPKVPGANDTQCMGAGLSYGMKYLLVSALNLSVGGMDCDGAPEPSPAPEADPDAPDAATRESRKRTSDLYQRYRDAGGPKSGWWPMVRKTVGVEDPKVDVTPTPAEWDKVEVVIGEGEGLNRGTTPLQRPRL